MSERSWKATLGDAIPERMESEIDAWEGQIALKKDGQMEDRIFAETRLRRGVYGQRYDNGLRNDGTGQQPLEYPCGDLKKGPDTVWDAPGMQRIKIPYGRMTAEQLDVLSDLAEEYSDSILHITTRQDIQLHFIHIEDTPDIHRRLAAVGITTREACGNSVRNVTACQFAGVCNTESFDVAPYAHAMTEFLLGHPDVQDFGRKFKIAFSGCHGEPCGLVTIHDLGATAVLRDGQRGFRLVVGGGLGAVPVEAKVLMEFCPERELLPVAQAVCRIFARLGEKQSRARARIKFLVQKVGIEEFRNLVREERAQLRPDPRWTDFIGDVAGPLENPIRNGAALPEVRPEDSSAASADATRADVAQSATSRFATWAATNLRPQSQPGYYVATVTCPLGDLTSHQGWLLADLARKYTGDAMRCTVEQNLAFRWLSGADALDFWKDLDTIGLGEPGASTITDVTACPGTDTCKLGISSSRGLAGELRKRLSVVAQDLDPAVRALRIKASGCFNSCSQHHIADLGFLGVSRNVGGRKVPHFNVVLGGEWNNNGGSYGMVVGAVPSKNVPRAVEMITEKYLADRESEETFQAFIARVGKPAIRELLKPITKPPSYEEDRSYYSDWRDPREYTIGDLGIGECAGEVIPFVEFGIQAAEQQLDQAQDLHDMGEHGKAATQALQAMLTGAQALVRHLGHEVRDDADDIVKLFRTHLHDTGVFHDPFAGGKFASYLFSAHDKGGEEVWSAADAEASHRLLDEARLFIEATHSAYARMTEAPTPTAPSAAAASSSKEKRS